jgi:hypothetical protein
MRDDVEERPAPVAYTSSAESIEEAVKQHLDAVVYGPPTARESLAMLRARIAAATSPAARARVVAERLAERGESMDAFVARLRGVTHG